MWHNVFFGVSGMRRVTPPSEDSIIEMLAGMNAGYLGAPFVCGQVNETDAQMFGLDFGYMGGPLVGWSNE